MAFSPTASIILLYVVVVPYLLLAGQKCVSCPPGDYTRNSDDKIS